LIAPSVNIVHVVPGLLYIDNLWTQVAGYYMKTNLFHCIQEA